MALDATCKKLEAANVQIPPNTEHAITPNNTVLIVGRTISVDSPYPPSVAAAMAPNKVVSKIGLPRAER